MSRYDIQSKLQELPIIILTPAPMHNFAVVQKQKKRHLKHFTCSTFTWLFIFFRRAQKSHWRPTTHWTKQYYQETVSLFVLDKNLKQKKIQRNNRKFSFHSLSLLAILESLQYFSISILTRFQLVWCFQFFLTFVFPISYIKKNQNFSGNHYSIV